MTYFGLVRRNLGRNRLRSVLTGFSIGLSIFLVCAVLTLPGLFRSMIDRFATSTRISVHNKAGLTYMMPYGYLQKVRSVPGVVAATSFTWFGGIYDQPKNLFPNFAIDVDAAGAVWPDYGIDPEALSDFRRYRDAALVGYQTMRTFGWKVGDRITLRGTVWPVDLEFRIVGVMPEGKGNPIMLWFSRVYLEEALRAKGISADVIGMIWARVDQPGAVEAAMRRIDDLFRNSDYETASETEKSFFMAFMGSLLGITWIITAVGFLGVAAVVFIAANSCSMSIRERAREIAVLKALGFSRPALLGMLLAEAMLLAVAGGFTGAFGSYGFLKFLARIGATGVSPALGPLSMFVMTVSILVQGLFLSLLVGMLAGAVPSIGAARKPVALALREVF
ncbi:MAG: ABC transporter permease [Candidatus Binatia bacterium]